VLYGSGRLRRSNGSGTTQSLSGFWIGIHGEAIHVTRDIGREVIILVSICLNIAKDSASAERISKDVNTGIIRGISIIECPSDISLITRVISFMEHPSNSILIIQAIRIFYKYDGSAKRQISYYYSNYNYNINSFD
jgi:hypothetical protein